MQTTQRKKDEEGSRTRRESGPMHFAEAGTLYSREGITHPQPHIGIGNPYEASSPFNPGFGSPFGPVGLQTPTFGLPQALAFQNLMGANVANPWLAFAASQASQPWASGQRSNNQAGAFAGSTARQPPVDIVDEGSEFVCQVELPGVKMENVDLACFERGLLVTAQAEPDIDVGALVQSERGITTSYRRAINLPAPVQPSGAKATLRDGILTVNLPKANPTESARRIPVT
ncbi:MAG: hypothetical protein QOC71_878 [Thermoplasmata archaeon]|jgi:HSP20 family protein|nr:hypothetical protein [Thermoplasmata archaeon]